MYENRDREINWYTQVKRSPTVSAKKQKAEPEATRTPHAGVSGVRRACLTELTEHHDGAHQGRKKSVRGVGSGPNFKNRTEQVKSFEDRNSID